MAPMMPPSTSPEPAVARAGQARGLTARRESGDAMIEWAPLRTTTAPVAATSSRAARNRSPSTCADRLSEEPRQLAGVRREDGVLRREQDAGPAGEHRQRVGVDDHGPLPGREHVLDRYARVVAEARVPGR